MIGIIYHLFALIDSIIYGLASSLFRIIFDLANTPFFKDEQILTVANRVYIVVGVLMLFKLVISAVQYLINPEVFDDKEKGLGGVLKKTAISIGLIVVIPTIFQFLMAVQGPIIKTLPSVILGTNPSERVDDTSIGFDLSFQVLSAFVVPNPGKGGSVSNVSGEIHDLWSFNAYVHKNCPTSIFQLGSMENCVYNYKIILSTICGGFLCYVLLSMVLDIAIRTIKMGIVQILAPIPISSYMFSKDSLNKFIKTASTVYFDLFIRMGIVYFIIFALQQMFAENGAIRILNGAGAGVGNTGDGFRTIVVNIAIIFGLLMFAKNAPKFISELLGLPDIGASDMADMFKPAWQRAGGAFGALTNPAANAISNFRNAMATNRGLGKDRGKTGAMLRRLLNAGRRAAGGFGKGALDSVEGMMNGENWDQMRNRHNAAAKRSLERAIKQQRRIETPADGQNRIKQIQNQIEKVKEKLKLFNDPTVELEAKARLDKARTDLHNLGVEIQTGINNGTLTGAALDEKLKQYQDLMIYANNKDFIRDEKVKIAAERKDKEELDAVNAQIAEQDAKIASATTAQERVEAEIKKRDLEQKLEDITHAKAKAKEEHDLRAANANLVNIDTDIAANDSTIVRLNADKTRKLNEAQNKIDIINAKLAAAGITDAEKAQLTLDLEQVINQRNADVSRINADISSVTSRNETLKQDKEAETKKKTTAETNIKEIQKKLDERRKTIEKNYTDLIGQLEKLDNPEIKDENGKVIRGGDGQLQLQQKQNDMVEQALKRSGMLGKFDAYLGGVPVSGKGYTDLASLLGQTRSSIYTGEAMTKLRQNADILVDENNNPLRFTTKFGSKEYSYEDMVRIKNMLDRSEIDDAKLSEDYGFKNSALFGSAFEDIEKKAAAAYITANIAMVDPRVKAKYTLKRPDVNSAVIETWNTFVNDLVKAGVPEKRIGELIDDFQKDPGDFMARASTIKDMYSSAGKQVIDVEKPDTGNK